MIIAKSTRGTITFTPSSFRNPRTSRCSSSAGTIYACVSPRLQYPPNSSFVGAQMCVTHRLVHFSAAIVVAPANESRSARSARVGRIPPVLLRAVCFVRAMALATPLQYEIHSGVHGEAPQSAARTMTKIPEGLLTPCGQPAFISNRRVHSQTI
jgi:hypothetical protein